MSFRPVLLLLLLIAACTDERRDAVLPPDAPGVIAPDEYWFGDEVASLDWRAQRQVLDQLEAEFGTGNVRLETRAAPADLAPETVREHYERALVAERGWQPLPLTEFPIRLNAWAAAFVSEDGSAVLAVVGLRPRSEADRFVPVSILTNIPRPGEAS